MYAPAFSHALFLALAAAAVLVMWRLVRGPSAADRAAALFALGALAAAFAGLLALLPAALPGAAGRRDALLAVALAWSALNFVAALAVARYLEGRDD